MSSAGDTHDRPLTLGWVRREPPLAAVAVAGTGPAARALTRAVRERPGALRVAAGQDWIVVWGEADDLPWADGACYLGSDAGLLVPTTRRPVPSAELWRDRLLGPLSTNRVAVLMPGQALITTTPVRPVDPGALPEPG